MSQQAAHGTFVAIAPTGASMTRTHLALAPGKRHPHRARPMEQFFWSAALDADMVATAHWDDVPDHVKSWDSEGNNAPWRDRQPLFVVDFLEPFVSARQAANVRVPVLLVYGEADVTKEPLEDAAVFRSAPEVAVAIVPGTGHLHNTSTQREQVWARLHLFAQQVVELPRLVSG